MNNKVLITGAMSGIGLACARLFWTRAGLSILQINWKIKKFLMNLFKCILKKFFYTKTDVSKDKDIKYLHSKN